MERKCPNCNESIGDFRCRATEKILAGMTRPCRFKKHGCTETVRYTEARNHAEELCSYAPYRCQFDGCAFRGCLLYGHILDAHAPGTSSGMDVHGDMTLTLKKCESFRALMDCDGESVVLLLNRDDVLTGRSLAVVRVCPYPDDEDPEGVEMKKYSITVEGGEPGTLSLTASGTLPFVRRLVGYKPKGFLFVPDDFWGSSGSVTITVRL
jgi:E3 ubiquitin-protein ligase SIAH1